MGFVHTSDDAQEQLHANARRLTKAEPKFMDRGIIYRRSLAVPLAINMPLRKIP